MVNENKQEEDVKFEYRFPKIGVEPVMFLYMSAYMMTSVVGEQFFIFKACTVNLGFPKNICEHIMDKANQNYNKQVQVEVSKFFQYEGVTSNAIPLVLAFILGGWSDRVGRKLPLLLGLFGCLIYYFALFLNNIFELWPLEAILYTACFPSALTGMNLSIFMACFAYLADTTPIDQRTLRTTLLEVAYLLPMPIGTALGSYLYNGPLKISFKGMFLINCAILSIAILYTLLVIPWRTRDPPKDGDRACTLGHIVDTLKILLVKRKEGRRMIFILCLIGMALFTLQRDESRMIQLYTQLKFNWTVKNYSNFRTFQTASFILGLLVGIPLLQKCFHIRDTVIMMIGATSHISARIIFIITEAPEWYYVGAAVATLGPVVAAVLRSITSKLVPQSERGKAFALLSISDTTPPLFSGYVFSQVYIHTINTPFPEAFYLVVVVSQTIVFLIALFINAKLHGKNITEAQEYLEERDIQQ
ncbi:probable peptidoglycan muropeptide transporter SLC46 [Halyomorpha halys]|uniref:probable peptidoglycan muropeptide transporter SLC46 n=1 Tax=Halyomorpha halys TaxID=286706 RepID=UPI0006D4CF7E|nr:proton-coupled folate transporter-like [Halyomorpha halys]